ncbi:MAG: hypothetical protein ACJAYJ_004736 [Saprospiraceae bacterium]|jgi:hypothetical protein
MFILIKEDCYLETSKIGKGLGNSLVFSICGKIVFFVKWRE